MSFFDDQMEEWELGGCQGDPTEITDFSHMAAEAEREQRAQDRRRKAFHLQRRKNEANLARITREAKK